MTLKLGSQISRVPKVAMPDCIVTRKSYHFKSIIQRKILFSKVYCHQFAKWQTLYLFSHLVSVFAFVLNTLCETFLAYFENNT